MNYIKSASEYILPLILFIFLIASFRKKEDAFKAFSDGARESLGTITDIFPSVFSLMTAIGMLRASGLLGFLTELISPLFSRMGIPGEIIPAALLRPLSGSGSIALLSDILKSHSPDSLIGIMACVIIGSTETTFYTISVYFGSIGKRAGKETITAALIADFVSISTGIILCIILF